MNNRDKELRELNKMATKCTLVAFIGVFACIGGYMLHSVIGAIIFALGLIVGIFAMLLHDSYINDISAIDFEIMKEDLEKKGLL